MRLALCTNDALLFDGVLFSILEVSDRFITVRDIQNGTHDQSFTHDELAQLIDKGSAAIEYGYFKNTQVARRARGGRSLLSRLSPKTQAHVFNKELWVRSALELEAEGTFNRSSKRWGECRKLLCQRFLEKYKAAAQKRPKGQDPVTCH